MNPESASSYDRPRGAAGPAAPQAPATPVNLAVVGHTNVGKTSLLRTLLRDVAFGEVSHRPSTTRHVEGAALSVGGQIHLVLHDTPGMEDGIGLREYLERLAQAPAEPTLVPGHQDDPGLSPYGSTGGLGSTRLQPPLARTQRLDGPDTIAAFLRTAEASDRYEQEAKVLRQMLQADAALYVVDVRDPVLPKYRDELAVLAMAGKPLLPVLNFVLDAASQEPAWRDMLGRLGLHAAIRFDTVAPPLDGEQRLYDSLSMLLEPARPVFQRLQAELVRQARERRATAARLVAELLLDVAAVRLTVASDEDSVRASGLALHDAVRQREQRCSQALLALYAFRQGDAASRGFPSFEGVWDEDLFSTETLRQFGIKLGGGMAAGAAVGAGLDVMLAGLSLGTATLVGALAGGALQTLRDYGQRMWGRVQGERVLRVDDTVLRLVALRQLSLVRALEMRGHAAQDVIRIDDLPAVQAATSAMMDWRHDSLPPALHKARSHPEWSSLNRHENAPSAAWRQVVPPQQPERQQQVQALAMHLI